ncbi:MAG: hypothetical protein FD152_1423 [Xanthobacteraceae bacterium]|nr:MAG: hypothetical protein FD152_1423 [Xanthobacteraceae bacterium]
MVRSTTAFGIAAGTTVIVAATTALASSYAAARDDQRRADAWNALQDNIRKSYPNELADTIIHAIGIASDPRAFNIEDFVRQWNDRKLYKFLFFNTSEAFADHVLGKQSKLANFGIFLPLKDLFDRCLADGFQGSSEALFQRYVEFLQSEEASYVPGLRRVGEDAMASVLANETIAAARPTFIRNSNVFVTDTGPVIVSPESKCAQIVDGHIFVFPDLATYEQANPRNRRWDYISSEAKKSELIEPHLDLLLEKIYA